MKSIIFLIVGAALIVGAVLVGLNTRRFLASASVAPGVVSELRHGGSHPTITFTTSAGSKISYAQNGFIFGYSVGQTVRVYYLPADPEGTAEVDSFGSLWTWTLGLGLIGLGFLGIAATEFTTKLGAIPERRIVRVRGRA